MHLIYFLSTGRGAPPPRRTDAAAPPPGGAGPQALARPARLILMFVALAGATVIAQQGGPPKTTAADITRWMTELSNWGRWGKDDQRGTLNLITPEKRRQALALVRDGVSVSLAHTLDKEQFADNPRLANPRDTRSQTNTPVTGAGTPPEPSETAQFGIAPNKRRDLVELRRYGDQVEQQASASPSAVVDAQGQVVGGRTQSRAVTWILPIGMLARPARESSRSGK